MRGTHVAAHHHEIRLGIIPAHAGNTTTCQSSHPARRWIIPAHAGNTRRCRRIPLRFRDHPRACGEHMPPSCSMLTVEGSSPRMRGTRDRVPASPDVMGIIPAHAGNTRECLVADCGAEGSSPRMRGTLAIGDEVRGIVGIIPAHAGNTSQYLPWVWVIQDHPRACGEHAFAWREFAPFAGSSPRMRGTRRAGRQAVERRGIIPAHAGNTILGNCK